MALDPQKIKDMVRSADVKARIERDLIAEGAHDELIKKARYITENAFSDGVSRDYGAGALLLGAGCKLIATACMEVAGNNREHRKLTLHLMTGATIEKVKLTLSEVTARLTKQSDVKK